MSEIVQNSAGLGVILNPPPVVKKQGNQHKIWCFTWNNYVFDDIQLLVHKFKDISIKYCFQEETGKSGTKHLQGVVTLKKRMRWTEMKLGNAIHWEKCIDEIASYRYCSKEDTRTGELYTFGIPKPVKTITELYEWQNIFKNFYTNNEPDGRTINWYYDKDGGMGKSAFCKYMAIKHNALVIQGGKSADILNIIFNTDMDLHSIVIIDVPRCNKANVSYNAIECILNGMITNTKFETGVKYFNAPHVIVFSNFIPDVSKLSYDRWKLFIRQKMKFIHHVFENEEELIDLC